MSIGNEGRWYSTGITLTGREYDAVKAAVGYVLIEFDYFYDDIHHNGFVIEGVNYDYEKFIPKRGVVKSVSPHAILHGYSWIPEVKLSVGDRVWISPFAGYASAGKSEAGKGANKSFWTEGRYCTAVRHQEIVVSQDANGKYYGHNGLVILKDVEAHGYQRNRYHTGVVAMDSYKRVFSGKHWPLNLKIDDKVLLSGPPLKTEYDDIAELKLWYASPDFVVAKILD